MVALCELHHKRFDDDGRSLLRVFGMNGAGVSFICDSCGATIANRLPIRSGSDDSRWFCSLPCGWMDNLTEDNVERLCRWLSITDPSSNSEIKTLVIESVVVYLEVINGI